MKIKQAKGITLVALIITIIVMLILVAVTLNIALGNNGIVNNAKKASEETRRGMYQEELLSIVIGTYNQNTKEIDEEKLKNTIEQKGWSYNVTSDASILKVLDKDNQFIAYVNISTGEIKDSNSNIDVNGGNGNVEPPVNEEEVILTGTYMGESNFEIQNNDTFVLDGTSYPLSINTTNKTATVDMGSSDVVLNYDIITESNEVINVVLLTGNSIYYQSKEGLTFELSGNYINNTLSLRFDSTNGTVSRVLTDPYNGKESIGDGELDMLYCGYNGTYYIRGKKVEVSSDLSQVIYELAPYIKE